MAAKANPATPSSSLADVEVIKFLLMHAFYLSLNFVPLAALLSVYFVYKGYTFAYLVIVLGAVDLLLPLKRPGFWLVGLVARRLGVASPRRGGVPRVSGSSFPPLLATCWLNSPPDPAHLSQAFTEKTDVSVGKQRFFDAEVIVETKFEKEKNYIIGQYPHSLYNIGYDITMRKVAEQLPGLEPHFAGADVIFSIPLLRRFMTYWGMVSTSRKNLTKMLLMPFPRNGAF